MNPIDYYVPKFMYVWLPRLIIPDPDLVSTGFFLVAVISFRDIS